VVTGIRVPGRFSIVGILALAVLGSLGLAWAAARWRRAGWAICLAASALAFIEFYPARVTTQAAAIPPAYQAIAASPDGGAVLEIPLQWRTGFLSVPEGPDTTVFLYYATLHHHPLVGGATARYPQSKLDVLLRVPLYRQVLALQRTAGF